MVGTFGMSALLTILLSLVCIALSWWALQSFRFDLFVRNPDSAQSKLLQILLSVVLGHGVARFFMDYLGSSILLQELFK